MRFVVAATLAAVALPVFADSGDKFSLVMSPTAASAGPITFTATIKNLAKFDFLKSATVTVPAGLTIGGTTTSTAGTVSVAGQVVSISGLSKAYNASFAVTINVSPSSTLGCGSNVLAWGATAKGGLLVSNEVFNLDATKSVLQTTVTNNCTVTLTYAAGANGSISGTSPQTVNLGTPGTAVTAVPDATYHFGSWSDGVLTATRTDPGTANVNVTASFAINTYTLTYTPGTGGTISGSTPQTVNQGGSGGQVTAVPGTGFAFSSWSDGSTSASRTDAGVTANLSVTANFVPTYTLTYTAGPNGTISGASPQTVAQGQDGSPVTANGTGSYHFKQWSDGSTANPRTDTNVQGNISVTASFVVTNAGCGDLQTSQGPGVSALDPFADTAFTTSNQWGVRSGPSLAGSTDCPNASYVFTLQDKIASLISDRPPDSPGAVFKYVIVWPPVPVEPESSGEPAGWSQKRPQVAWVKDGMDNPVYTPALFCPIDPNELASYTTTALLDSLMPTIPNVPPFDTLGNTYMQYAPGQKAKMCISQQGATSFGTSGGVIQIQYWDKVIDESDGFTKMP